MASSLTNTTSNQVSEFSGTFTIAMFWALLDFVNRNLPTTQSFGTPLQGFPIGLAAGQRLDPEGEAIAALSGKQ